MHVLKRRQLGLWSGREIGRPEIVGIVSEPPILADILVSLVSPYTDTPIYVTGNGRSQSDIALLIAIDLHGTSVAVADAISSASPMSNAVINIRGKSVLGDIDEENDTFRSIGLPGSNPWDGGLSAIVAGLSALAGAGVAPAITPDVLNALSLMRRQSRAYSVPIPYDTNPAKRLALLLGGRLTYLLSSNAPCELIAGYWRDRFSRYAKVIACVSGFRGVGNEMLGWRNAIRQSDQWSVVAIRNRDEPEVGASNFRCRSSTSIPDDIPVHDVFADGDSHIERVIAGMYYGEFVAGYLSLMWNEDPGRRLTRPIKTKKAGEPLGSPFSASLSVLQFPNQRAVCVHVSSRAVL